MFLLYTVSHELSLVIGKAVEDILDEILYVLYRFSHQERFHQSRCCASSIKLTRNCSFLIVCSALRLLRS